MASRLAIVAIALAALTLSVGLQAQDPPPTTPAQIKENLTLKEQILARQYQEFEQQLLRLKQRLERSSKQEERDQALVLDRVLEYCKDKSLSVQFEQMVDILKSKELKSLPDIEAAMNRSKDIAKDLQEVIAMLREDTRAKSLRDEIARIQDILKQLDAVIQNQKTVQGLTDNNKTDPKELKKIQNSVSQKTADIAQKLGGKEGSGKEKNSKGDPKAGGKNGEKAGEAKGDGEKPPETAQAKPGGEGQEPKSGTKPGGEGKEGEKGQAKPGEGSPKPGQAKESKPGQGEPGQAKAGSGKPGEAGKGKQGEAKSGESKDGQSQAKGDGSQPNSTNPPSGQQAANKGGDKKGPAGAPKENPQVGRKQVEEGYDRQQQAEKKIEEKKNEEASAKQTEALDRLEKAKKELEKLLRQLREEELERILAALQARCEKMLAMQMQVLSGTESVDKAIIAQLDKMPDRANKQESLKLSDSEGDIVVEASKAIEILEAEGSAVAFPEVFQQVREDMKHVQRRLGITDVGTVTQAIERDIIDSLKEMIEALKKQRSDSKSKSEGGSPPPNQDQKLLEKIAELKMIRSMQIRVNTRTQTYGRMYPGEQAADPNIRRELHNLSERQERIFEVTNRMAKGDSR